MNHITKAVLILTLSFTAANATLVKTDFLNPNDGLIVRDNTTNFEWLAPLYTRGLVYNAPLVTSTPTPNSGGAVLAFGMFQFGSTGWFISNNNWGVNISDPQMGSFLVRPYVESTVPEPTSTALIGLGLVLFASHRKIRSSLTR
ncbi:MAG: PEP-CTERM sorting domain-containing protein [Acidobacteria bacterium]|nr:PEP-CTERM sorting domain-containing protein [Acidobacteriota bacterium]